MMTGSGVLRPGDHMVRRGPGGVPLYATSQVSEMMNRSLDVLFGPEIKPNQQKVPKLPLEPKADTAVRCQTTSSRFSPKAILIGLGLLNQGGAGSPQKSPSPQAVRTRLEAQIHKLESLLKAEKAICQAQRDELIKLRDQSNQIEALEADLAIERESSARLVHWLQESERELADLRETKCENA